MLVYIGFMVKGGSPACKVKLTAPSLPPLQVIFDIVLLTKGSGKTDKFKVMIESHPFVVTNVSVCVPAEVKVK